MQFFLNLVFFSLTFVILFQKFEENDVRICSDCLKFVSDIEQFVEKTNSIQNMFLELNNCSSKEEFSFCDLDEIRLRFGLNELNVNSLDFLTDVLEEPSIKQEKPEEIENFKCKLRFLILISLILSCLF